MGGLFALTFLVIGFFSYFSLIQDSFSNSEIGAAIAQKIREFGVRSILSFALLGFFISVIHSWLEEYYWRGFVLDELQAFVSAPKAIFISSVAFTLHHIVVIARYAQIENRLFWISSASLVVFACGLIWAWKNVKYQSIYAPWISHIAADLVIVGIAFDLIYL